MSFFAMSKPRGKCAFCGEAGDLTKSHIWPDWAATILPQTATHHEQIIGKFHTFTPAVAGPEFYHKLKPGHVGARKPRNTCKKCNGDWMRKIEEATMPFLDSLLLRRARSIDLTEQRALAALLCLVSMRIDASSRMKAVPRNEHQWLMNNPEPPASWKIWIARYVGSQRMDQQFTAMHLSSSPNVPTGVEHCNTQVTSLVVGHLYAHLYSSIQWPGFPGYDGFELAQLWPLTYRTIEIDSLPTIFEGEVPWIHETIARTRTPISK
jgi:hypothetical protein